MNLYCLVEDGAVTRGPIQCPSVFNNISAFRALSDADKKTHGWYPANITKPSYNQYCQYLAGPVFTINAGDVDAVWMVQDRPLDEGKTALIYQLKAGTRERILAESPEYAQRNAALGILTQGEIDTVKANINTHRDACNTAEANINAATTVADAMAVYDTWSSP